MRISELSETTGVPVATIKYYLREGLLPAGERTSATRATYDESHVARLQLVRALLGVGGLSVATAQQVLAVYDDPPASIFDAVGSATELASAPVGDQVDLTEARALLDRLGWDAVHGESAELHQLAAALRGLRDGDIELIDGGVERYAGWMAEVATAEINTLPVDDPARAVRQSLLGTVLVEPLLLALRRLAHQQVAFDQLVAEQSAD